MTEKANLEGDLARLKEEFVEFTTPPVELMPLILPGCRMMANTCARCHHRGDTEKTVIKMEFVANTSLVLASIIVE